jgi:hypothetical protein
VRTMCLDEGHGQGDVQSHGSTIPAATCDGSQNCTLRLEHFYSESANWAHLVVGTLLEILDD